MATSLLKTIGLSFLGSTISFLSDITLGDEWSIQILKENDKTKDLTHWSKLKQQREDLIKATRNFSFLNENSENWIKIADFDSFVSMNGVYDSQIVENSIEKGSFRSVNKVARPKQFIIELARGGGFKFLENGIKNMLYNLEQYQGSTVLCRIITPYGVITNLNLKKLEYSFTHDTGSCLLIAKLTFQEIISKSKVVEPDIKTVKNSNLTNTVNTGIKSGKAI